MTTTIAYGDATDGYLTSNNASYATALAGPPFAVDTAATTAYWGQNNNGGTYTVLQAFLSFTYTPSSTEKITAAYIRVKANTNLSTGVSRDLVLSEYDWGASLTTADWRTPSQLNALTTEATITNAEDAGTNFLMAGSDTLVSRLASSGPLRLVAASSRNRSSTSPVFDEGSTFVTADASGTPNDPALIYTSVPASRLFGVLGAQVQLSDGTHAYLESSSETPDALNLTLKHHNGTSASTISTLTVGVGPDTGFAPQDAVGAQSYALAVDASDNLYVVGAHKGQVAFGAQAFLKGVGYSWTQKAYLSASAPSYTDGAFNNFAAAWHNVGTNGTIMVIAAHTAGRTPNTTGDIVYALLNCQSLLAGSGTLLRNSGAARTLGGLIYASDPSGYYTFYDNETGSELDVVAAPGTSDRGYIISATSITALGEVYKPSIARYVLDASGTSVSAVSNAIGTTDQFMTKDAAAKTRVIAIDGTTFVTITADPAASGGIYSVILQNTGTSTLFVELAESRLGAEGLATMPSTATLTTSSAWDAIYDSGSNKLYVYYTDTANSNRLMRTSIDMNTYLATGEQTQVSAAIGAAGSTTYALRVHRGKTNGQQVLISCASKTSGGVHSTIYVTNALNQAPNAPTLTPKANFDATAAATFNWTFSDPNPGDTQSAYQLQIVDVSDGSVDYDSGKVTSGTSSKVLTAATLTNGKSYQWRVLTYDSLDAVGPYSTYGTFSTASGGTVTVTDPASDNPAGVNHDDYTISWSVSGTTQAAYRVVVTRTDTSAELLNTGWVTSTATSYAVTGMLTGVEYQVAVTVRNASLIESGTGTRLITPDYDNVPTPTITATVAADGSYITLAVTNGVPTGDNPAATSNQILRRRAGTSDDYVAIASIDPDSSYKDYAVASGVTYEYVARAVA